MVSAAAGKPSGRRLRTADGLVTYFMFNAPEERPVREHAEYHVYPEVQAVGTALT